MTYVTDLKDKQVLAAKLEEATDAIYQHLQETMTVAELHNYLVHLGIERQIKRGELERDYEPATKEEVLELAELGRQSLINAFSFIQFSGQFYGVFYFNSGRGEGDPIEDISQDLDAFDEIAEGVPLAIMLYKNEHMTIFDL